MAERHDACRPAEENPVAVLYLRDAARRMTPGQLDRHSRRHAVSGHRVRIIRCAVKAGDGLDLQPCPLGDGHQRPGNKACRGFVPLRVDLIPGRDLPVERFRGDHDGRMRALGTSGTVDRRYRRDALHLRACRDYRVGQCRSESGDSPPPDDGFDKPVGWSGGTGVALLPFRAFRSGLALRAERTCRPISPCGPAGPVSPRSCRSGSPAGRGPMSPCGPAGPVSPCGPAGPVSPLPVLPVLPVLPGLPGLPGPDVRGTSLRSRRLRGCRSSPPCHRRCRSRASSCRSCPRAGNRRTPPGRRGRWHVRATPRREPPALAQPPQFPQAVCATSAVPPRLHSPLQQFPNCCRCVQYAPNVSIEQDAQARKRAPDG